MSTALFVLGTPGADRLTRTRPHLGAVVLDEVVRLRDGEVVKNDPTPPPHHPTTPRVFNLDPAAYSPPGTAPSD
jgi:thiamine biosynthesis lipoprotein